MIKTVTNLYPYPNQPTRGVFNLQLFKELANRTKVHNHVLVAHSNPFHARRIRAWQSPTGVPKATYIPYQHIPIIGRTLAWHFIAHALQAQTADDEHSPHAILSSWLYPDGTATALAFQNTKLPVWTMVLGTDRFHLNNRSRRTLILKADHYTTGYICVSQNIADDLAKAGISENKLHVVRNGVDITQFRPIPHGEAISHLSSHGAELMPEPTPFLLFIGNLVPIKAPDVALKAFATLRSTYSDHRPPSSDLRLLFIGDGPMRPQLEDMTAELGISANVTFLGQRPHAEIPLWLNIASALMLSSKSEGMPNAIAEALACGCPVVATDVGACREMLDNQPCCKIVTTDSSIDMSQAIETLLTEAAQTNKRPTFTRTWAAMAEDVMNLMG